MEPPPGQRLLLIVTGSHLRAEEADRPLAYYLKQQIEEQADDVEVIAVSDFRWLHEESFQELPSISVGGPAVNAVASEWLDELPLALAIDDQFYIQLDPEQARASIWGMDNSTTQIAVAAFLQRYLSRFLERSEEQWARVQPSPDDDQEAD